MSTASRRRSTKGSGGKENGGANGVANVAEIAGKVFDEKVGSMAMQLKELQDKLTELQERASEEVVTEEKIKGWIQAPMANQPSQAPPPAKEFSTGGHSCLRDLRESKHATQSLQL